MSLRQEFTSQTSVGYFPSLASLKGLGLEGSNKKNRLMVFLKYKMLDNCLQWWEFISSQYQGAAALEGI